MSLLSYPLSAHRLTESQSSIAVTKPVPYTFDLGNLLVNDANLLSPKPTNAEIAEAARDCAQGLINQLLTVCPITSHVTEGVLLTLPRPTTQLPREKPLPSEREKTKWERFAEKRGIKKKPKDTKMVYDEATGEWVPRWGYKGKNKNGEDAWIVEVDEKKESELKEGQTIRGMGRRERVEKVRRNERMQRANDRKQRKKP